MAKEKPEHERTGYNGKCNARLRKSDGRCGRPSGWGTDHFGRGPCKLHGGNGPAVRMHHARAELVERLSLGFVQEKEITPAQAILWTVQLSAGAVEWLRLKIDSEGVSGMVGYVYGEAGHRKEAKPSVWVQLYNEERDRLAKASKLALDAGVAERQVRLAEQQGQLVALAIRKILDGLGLSAEQKALAPNVVREALLSLPVGSPTPPLAGAKVATALDEEEIDWEED